MLFDKFSGMFYGMLIGDNLGIINKFTNKYIEDIRPIYSISTGEINFTTKCMFELCNHIIQYKNYDRYKATEIYIELFFKHTNLNNTNFKILTDNFKIYPTIENIKMYYDSILIGLNNRELLPKTNESLLRSIPLILFDYHHAIEDCYITNPQDDCVSCNLLFLKILDRALNDEPVEVQEYWSENFNIKRIIKLAKNNLGLDLKYHKNTCYNTLYCSLYAYLHFNKFEEGIKWVIEQSNEDVCENAYLVGCILGAKLGKKIMDEEITYYNMMRILESHKTNKYITNLETYVKTFTELYNNKKIIKI
jgi:hypothetical protein